MRGAAPRIAVRAVDALASSSVAFGVPLLILRQSGSVTWAGTSFAAAWLPQLVAISAAAPWVDRLGARRAMVASASVRTAVVLLVLLDGTRTSTVTLAVLSALCGFLAPVSSVAADALTADAGRQASPRAGRRIAAWQAAVDQGAQLVGPLLAGLLVTAGTQSLLSGTVVLSLTAAGAATRLPNAPTPATGALRRPSLRSGHRVLRADPVLLWLTLGGLTMNCLSALVEVATPIRVTQTFHRSAAASGVVWSAGAVAALLSIVAVTKATERYGNWRVAALAISTSSIAALATALAPGYLTYLAAVAAMFAAEQGLIVVLRSVRQRRIPPHSYASATSLSALLLLSPFPLAGAAVGAAGRGGITAVLLICTGVTALGAALTLRGLSQYRAELADPMPVRANAASPVLLANAS